MPHTPMNPTAQITESNAVTRGNINACSVRNVW